ncbi:hypothetical protein Q1W73_01560 [Asticcacaulis sp. ZE23SCel15]|uniref:hypothetical protein n=1 Tax=Asticcacaulis sp. ZE23SCel15 TaxID=3059027 RepID=UPI00265DB936|nr:hypothetical protein [Asticcacaulis sp. ZE23SCel15]WKL57696.1 hypothetical protein Q1W73_01560 [Asticcacaulis sp. ZE23SCel15]
MKLGFVVGILVPLAFDVLLSALISLFADEYNKWSTFWVCFILLLIAPMLLGLWALIKRWMAYYLFARKNFKDVYLRELRSGSFPDPKGEFDIQEYMIKTANSDNVSKETQKRALQLWAEVEAYKQKDGFGSGLMMILGGQKALQEYDLRFSPRPME